MSSFHKVVMEEKVYHIFIDKICGSVLTRLFISYFSCAFKNNFATALRCAPRVKGIKLFSYLHDFSLSCWDSLHEKPNNHYGVLSYKETMKKRMKSF